MTSASTLQPVAPPTPSAQRRELIASVATLIDQLSPGRLLVAIDGMTASGKSTFGHEVACCLSAMKRQVLRASLDDFKRPWSEAHRYDRLSGAGYFRNAFDYERIEQLLLAPAAAGGTGNVALCSIDPLTQVDHSESTVDIESNGVLIVDGVFAFRSEINDFWDLKIWIDVDPELSIERGVRRDTAMEGSNEAAEELHRGRYQGSERIYLVECDPIDRADIVIDNRNFEAPRPIKSPQ